MRKWMCRGTLAGWLLAAVLSGEWAHAQATTTVQDTVTTASGTAAAGTVVVSWNAFTTAAGSAVAAGSVSTTLGAGGALNLALQPNAGATPMGSYYTAVYHLSDGTTSREFWVVPVAVAGGGPAKLAGIRNQVLPTSMAMQTVSKQYVDTTVAKAIAGVAGGSGLYLLKSGDTMLGPLALTSAYSNPAPYSDTQVTIFGDSLTAGNQDGTGVTVCTALTAATSLPCNNEGVPGQTSTQIAVRMGALATTVTNSGTIPAGTGAGVTMTFPAGYEPAFNAVGTGVTGTVNGVQGSLVDNGSRVYTFTRSTAGSPVSFAAGDAWVPVLGTLLNGLVVIEAGRNNLTSPAQVLVDIDAMVAALPGTAHTLIETIPNSNSYQEWIGGNYYDLINSLNQALVSKYPQNVVDERTLMIGKFANTLADHTWYAHDVPPESLHARYSSGTLTAALNSSACSFSVGLPNYFNGSIFVIDSEKIYVRAGSGTTVSDCVRGWEGTAAAAHAAGAAVTQIDAVHFNAAGYTFIAQQIANWMAAHPSTAQNYLTPLSNLAGSQSAQRGVPPQNPTQTTNQRELIFGLNGSSNFALGQNVMPFVTGTGNFALGLNLLQYATNVSANTVIGVNACALCTSNGNTAVGSSALQAQTTSSGNNTALGASAGSTVVQTNSSTFIGVGAGQTTDGLFDCTALGYGAQCTTYQQVMLGDTNVTQTVFHGTMIGPGFRETLTTPANSSAACSAGDFTDDANYHYVCVSANTWKRVALSSF